MLVPRFSQKNQFRVRLCIANVSFAAKIVTIVLQFIHKRRCLNLQPDHLLRTISFKDQQAELDCLLQQTLYHTCQELFSLPVASKIIGEARQYIRDFDRLERTAETAQELYDKMLELYPNRINPGWALWSSARAVTRS